MLTTVAKRIQTSLKRKGVVATSGDIKDYLKANAGNIENITKEEENNATKYFLSNATKLTVVSDDVTTEDLTEVEETFSSVGGELGNI
jgi:tRNA G46 methylase TrmB